MPYTMKIAAMFAFIAISAPAAAQETKRFPSGATISVSVDVQGIGGEGTITRRKPGQPTKTVTIGYMAEFTGILAENKVGYTVMGVTSRGQEDISCVATIDWARAKIISVVKKGSARLMCR